MAFTSRLRRRTVSEKYIANIDGLRFVAIASVVLLHIFAQNQRELFPHGIPAFNFLHPYSIFLRLVWHGARGVPLFFAISGFILGLPFARHRFHAGKPVSLSFYFLRRVTRLEPPYLLVLLLRTFLFIALVPVKWAYYFRHFAASAVYLHSLIYGLASIINLPAWSLEIEIQFYCLVPLLAFYFAIRRPMLRRVLLLAVMAASGLLQIWQYYNLGPRAPLSILFWIQYFLAGFFVADLYLTEWRRIPDHWLWEALTLPLWFCAFFLDGAVAYFFLPFAVILFFVSAFKGPLQRRFFSNTSISLIGGMCYSLYLLHALVLSVTGHAIERLPFALPALLIWIFSAAAVLLCGTIFFVLVERPCMDPAWPKNLWRKFFPEAAATTDPAV
jgi:peptidoglycan/LPS O-acetylase OafA/YrhL